MTLAPFVDPSVRGVEGKAVEINSHCVVPGCLSLAQERHHIFPKSYLRGQPTEWVTVQEMTVPNSCGLCIRHHKQVTGIVGGGHLAHIRWNETHQIFEWWENSGQLLSRTDAWVNLGPLRAQPLLRAEPEAARVRRQENLCSSCGQPKPRERSKPGPKRKVKTWAISVPDDAEEGAEVLDVYIEDLGHLMGYHDLGTRLLRYHVLVPALEWISQNRIEFLRDWEEAAN
jgi:chorismate mutase